jgi:hypothetical protein
MLPIDITGLQNHVKIAGLTLTNSQLAPKQAQSFLVCGNVARSFNVTAGHRQFFVIGAASGGFDIRGGNHINSGVDFDSVQIGPNDPNALIDRSDSANQLPAIYHIRCKRLSIAEREKKGKHTQTNRAVAHQTNLTPSRFSMLTTSVMPNAFPSAQTPPIPLVIRAGLRPPIITGYSRDPVRYIIATVAALTKKCNFPFVDRSTPAITSLVPPIDNESQHPQINPDLELNQTSQGLFKVDTSTFWMGILVRRPTRRSSLFCHERFPHYCFSIAGGRM